MSFKNNFASFVDGYTRVKNAEDDREMRQRESEQRAQEFEFRKRALERSESEAKRELEMRDGLRNAANPEKDDGFIVSGPNKLFSANQNDANALAKIEADAAELGGIESPVKVERGYGLKSSPEIVTQAQANDPLYGIGRQAKYLSSMGMGTEALKLNATVDAERERQRVAQQTRLQEEGLAAAQDGGAKGFANWYNSQNKGSKLHVIKNPDGGYSLVKAVNGIPELNSTYRFNDDGEFFSAVQMSLDPKAAAAQSRAVAAARAKQQADAQAFQNKELFKAQVNGRGIFSQPSAGSTVRGASTKQPESDMSVITELVDKFTPKEGDRTAVLATAQNMLDYNKAPPGQPQIPQAIIAEAASRAAMNPSAVQPVLNPNTLQWERVVPAQGGALIVVDRNVPEEAKKAVIDSQVDGIFKAIQADPNGGAQKAAAILGDQAAMQAYANQQFAKAQALVAKRMGRNLNDDAVLSETRRIVNEQVPKEIERYRQAFSGSESFARLVKKYAQNKQAGTNGGDQGFLKTFIDKQMWLK